MSGPPPGEVVEGKKKKGRGRFTASQILAILREHDAGVTVLELSGRYGISPTTFYKWRAKSATLVPSESNSTEPSRVALLEEENQRLKRLLGEVVLKNSILEQMLTRQRS
jgi:putative transposase